VTFEQETPVIVMELGTAADVIEAGMIPIRVREIQQARSLRVFFMTNDDVVMTCPPLRCELLR
jgi:hypothetical protein